MAFDKPVHDTHDHAAATHLYHEVMPPVKTRASGPTPVPPAGTKPVETSNPTPVPPAGTKPVETSNPTPVPPPGTKPVETSNPTPVPPPGTKPVEGNPKPVTPPGTKPVEGNPKPVTPPGTNPVEGNPNPPKNNPQGESPFSPPAFLGLPLPPRDNPHPKNHPPKTPEVPVVPPVPLRPVPLEPPPLVPPPLQPLPRVPQENTPLTPPPLVPPVTSRPIEPIPVLPPPVVPPIHVPLVHVPPAHVPPVHFKVPTGVFTGQGGVHSKEETDRAFNDLYKSGKQDSSHHAHLISDQLGPVDPKTGKHTRLNVDLDMVGTGADMGVKKHATEMVAPHDPFHLGQWKYSDPEQTGKTIIAGHVAYNQKPGPFYDLHDLGIHNNVRDQVVIQGADGKKTTYEFAGREVIKDPKDQKVWNKVFGPGDPNHKQLELLTCAGPVEHGVHKWRLVDYLTEVKAKDHKQPLKAHTEVVSVGGAAAQVKTGDAKAAEAKATEPKAAGPKASETLASGPKAPEVLPAAGGSKATADATPSVHSADAPNASAGQESSSAKLITAAADVASTKFGAATTAASSSGHSDLASSPVSSAAEIAPAAQNLHSSDSIDVITSNSPGAASQTRMIETHVLANPKGPMVGEHFGVGYSPEDHKVTYLAGGPDFSFVNTDKDIVRGNLRLGYGNDFEFGKPPGGRPDSWTASTQIDATRRFGTGLSPWRDTSGYLAGAFSVGTRGSAEVLETGLEQYSGKLLFRTGLQATRDLNAPLGTYGIVGATYTSHNFSLGLTLEQPLNHQPGQSSRPTGFLMFGLKI